MSEVTGMTGHAPERKATAAPSRSLSSRRRLSAVLITWLAVAGLDFLLNGAVFARMYQAGDAFMVEPSEAFRRIPLGYLAFLVMAAGMVELAHRLRVTGFAAGVILGAMAGAVFASAWSLGTFSIANLRPETAVALAGIWFMLVALAGGVAASALGRASLRRLVLGVGAFDVACIVIVIALQSLGVVATVKL